MSLPSSTIMFAIEAGVRLAQKGNAILIDKTAERPLRLPLGDSPPDLNEIEAREFFDRDENAHLTKSGGPYFGYTRKQLAEAYQTIQATRALGGNRTPESVIAEEVGRVEQFNRGFGTKPALRRLLGTVVEIGIDYALANPAVLGKNANQRKIIESFVAGLNETDFAEGSSEGLITDLLTSALKTFSDNTALVDDDPRTQALLGGVTSALLADADSIKDGTKKWTREQLLRRIGSSMLRGGAGAFSQNPDLFLPGNGLPKALVKSTVQQMLAGIKGREDWFNNESLELLFQSSMKAVAENAGEFHGKEMVQVLIRDTATVLGGKRWTELFSEQTAAVILQQALSISSEHMETMLRAPDGSQKQFAAQALVAMAESLSKSLAGNGNVHGLFSKSQLLDLTKIVLGEVARNPKKLLDGADEDPKKTVLAQAIGSMARALGDDPRKFVSGAGFIQLSRIALNVAVQNADQLIDLEKATPATNLLYEAIHQVVAAIGETGDLRKLVTQETFIEISRRVLPVVSANVTRMLDEEDQELVKRVASTALELAASDDFKGRINGNNIAILIGELLTRTLWEELNLDEQTAVANAAREVLRAAPILTSIAFSQLD
jgi:hypothetical protein